MTVQGIDDPTITQVCLIVKDVAQTAEHFRQILGFNLPTEYPITLRHDHTEALYHGQPTDARAQMLCVDMGRIQFELMQPLETPSTWHDFLAQHGEGIHHIAFFVQKADQVAQSFVQEGYQITQYGLFTGRGGSYTYLDTDKDLGIVVELLEHFGGKPHIQTPDFPAERGIGTDRIIQVGMIVNDIEATMAKYSRVLGFPQVPIQQTAGYDITKTTYKGQPSEATAKLAFYPLGQVTLELIEPDEKPSVWRDFLETNGEGAQHIALQVENTQQAVDHFAKYGIEVEQQGLYTSGGGMYTYMNSAALLGTTIELLENFKRG